MPPKKRKPTEDIRPFLNKKTVSSGGSSSTKSSQADGASTSQVEAPSLVRVKKEMEDDSEQDELPVCMPVHGCTGLAGSCSSAVSNYSSRLLTQVKRIGNQQQPERETGHTPLHYITGFVLFDRLILTNVGDNSLHLTNILITFKQQLIIFNHNSCDHFALELKKEDFGKIQQSFSEVHRVRELLRLGESVCKVIVSDVWQGTGFVLFDRLILTNAHLFKDCVNENKLQEDIEVYALFNFDKPEPYTNYYIFTAEKTFIDFDLEQDYAILELKPIKNQNQNQNQTAETEEAEVPPGLLSKIGPPPKNGEACLIGHPAGEVKQIDHTCIIPIEKREESVDKQLHSNKDTNLNMNEIIQELKDKGIDNIMKGGSKADKVVTYKTFMYHGSSGSPVFDAQGRVFGLHSSGYWLEHLKHSVIECAHPLLSIIENFVRKLKKGGNHQLLERIQAAGEGNSDLEEIIERMTDEEPMETN